jgi:melibiose permease
VNNFEEVIPTAVPEEENVSWVTKLNYGIGAVGKSLNAGAGAQLQIYLTSILHVPRLFIAVLFFAGRLWDGVNDLIMGTIVDNTHSKYGKFRPWIAIGGVTNALAVSGYFARPGLLAQHPAGMLVYIALLFLLGDLTYTMIDVSYWAMIPALSRGKRARDQLSMLPRIFSGVASIANAFIWNIVFALGGGKEDGQQAAGLLRWTLITAVLYVITSVYCAATVREPNAQLPKPAGERERFSLGRALSILLHNDQALVIVGVMILFNLACNLTNGVMGYYFLHVLKKETQLGFMNILWGAAQAVGLFLFPLLSGWFGRRKVYIGSLLLPCAGYAAMFLADHLLPEEFIPLAAAAFLASIGYGSMAVMQSVMLADAVDYGEHRTGLRNEGIIFSTLTMLSKLAGALQALILMAVFAVVKFGGEDAVEATPEAVAGIKFLMYMLPPVVLVLALLVYFAGYRLSEGRMAQINAELAQRRGLSPAADKE